MRRMLIAAGMAAGFSPWMVRAPHCAAYPVKPVRLMIPFASGGSTEIFSRLLSKHLFVCANEPFVVENVFVASRNIAAVAARHKLMATRRR